MLPSVITAASRRRLISVSHRCGGPGRVKMVFDRGVVAERRLGFGACEPVISLAWEPSPDPGTVALSTLFRLVCFEGSWRRHGGCRPSGRWMVDVIVERPAALDVHKAQVTACVRVPGPDAIL